VEFEEVPDFFDFIKLERYLEEILGFKVDLQTRDSISPSLTLNFLFSSSLCLFNLKYLSA